MTARIFMALLLTLSVSGAGAQTYHVSPDGNDANPGTSARPWRTLQKAASMVRPGATVHVRGGVYPVTEPIVISARGTAEKPIAFVGDRWNRAIVDAHGLVRSPGDSSFFKYGAVHVEGARHLRLENLEVRNARNVGFMIRGVATQNVDLIGCRTDQSYGSGVGVWYAQHVRVLGCEIVGANNQEMRRVGDRLRSEAPHEALSVAGARHFEIAHNHVHHGWKEGVDVKEVSAHGVVHHNHVHNMPRQGLYADSWFGLLEDVVFHSNLVHNSEWGIVVSAEGKGSEVRNIRIHDNVVHDNRASGILLGIWGHDLPRSNIQVYNNTVFRNGSAGHWGGSVGGIDLRSRNVHDSRIYNNIVFDNFGFEIASSDSTGATLAARNVVIERNLVGSNKLVYQAPRYPQWGRMYATVGRDAVVGDPRFVNAPYDFRLLPGSPAAGAGIRGASPGAQHLGAVQHVTEPR